MPNGKTKNEHSHLSFTPFHNHQLVIQFSAVLVASRKHLNYYLRIRCVPLNYETMEPISVRKQVLFVA